jgi:hypothetical protein
MVTGITGTSQRTTLPLEMDVGLEESKESTELLEFDSCK